MPTCTCAPHARTPSTLSVASSVMHSHHGHSHGHQGHGHTLSQSQSLAYSPASASYAALPPSSSGGNASGSAPPSRRTSQQNLGLAWRGVAWWSVSRRPSLLKTPSLPLLGETSVLGEDLDLGLVRWGLAQPQRRKLVLMALRSAERDSTTPTTGDCACGDVRVGLG
ncbi:hypothetical protein BDZ97DRAFT_125931 [Flammula alnicola]|nr:hypothetical protein BDZ97DRAFT_125931 [Flammula alnicola]